MGIVHHLGTIIWISDNNVSLVNEKGDSVLNINL